MTTQTSVPLEHQSLDATNQSARNLATMVQDGDIILDPSYQRGSVWTVDQRTGLVTSWLLGLPVPAIILNDRMSWPEARHDQSGRVHFAAIDGKQRLETAVAWFGGELAVPATWFRPEHVDRTEQTDGGPFTRFTWLTKRGQGYMALRAPLPVATAHVASVAEEAEIYLLVNGAGTSQTDEDLPRAGEIAQRNSGR
ncbi:DUF262 domain-containing protein [Nocardia sp. NRRL S-836]|uniref:DUF262 domain-containing protein n=1 Tax=Nocardia sp. NRRL S-836 TaxID=1519492 RepID=UPI0006B00649|nr:DUF262 domain-containing protein [Nocardia sp. NRRL S-836]KOV84646.1 hypothetical protein ADL03_15245 [Nocardia sp. NRRL S-836]